MTFIDSIFLSIAAFSAGVALVVIITVLTLLIRGERF